MTDDSFRGLTIAEVAARAQLAPEVVREVFAQEVQLGRLERLPGQTYRFSERGWSEVGASLASITPGYVPGEREVGRVRW